MEDFEKKNVLQTTTIDPQHTSVNLQKHVLNIVPTGYKSKSLKLEEDEIKSILFEMFGKAEKMNFEQINAELDQPSGYL